MPLTAEWLFQHDFKWINEHPYFDACCRVNLLTLKVEDTAGLYGPHRDLVAYRIWNGWDMNRSNKHGELVRIR